LTIAANLQQVKQHIAAAAARAGRRPEEITLVAVTKNVPPEAIRQAIEVSQTVFGENRVQEAEEKIFTLPETLEWHMIGRLQTNKVRRALELFSWIQSVDSLHLAEAIDKRCAQLKREIKVLLEVNIAGEATKAGFSPYDLPGAAEIILKMPHLQVQGLMTIAPLTADPELARPYFQKLRKMRDQLQMAFPQVSWSVLSMGMTDDFEVAIEEGSTMVRIGRAIFGERVG